MTKWARIEDGKVMETTDLDPTGRFHPSLVWVSCDDSVDQHYTYNGSTFAPPPPPPPTTAQDLAPGRTLEGLSADEIASFEALAQMINSNLEAVRQATQGVTDNV